MKKETFSQRKIGKQLVSVAMLGLLLAPVALQSASPVLAEEKAAQSTSNVDAELKSAIEKAKSLGIQVQTEGKKEFQSTAEANAFKQEQLKKLQSVIATTEAESSKSKKDYDALKKKYDEDKKKYDADKAKYDEDKKKYDAELAKMEADKNKEGHLSQAIGQAFVFNGEYDANVKITGGKFFKSRKGTDAFGENLADYRTLDEYNQLSSTQNDMIKGESRGDKSGWWNMVWKVGDKIKVEYTNLTKTSFAGKKISKVVYNYEVLDSPDSDSLMNVVVYRNPTVTLDISAKNTVKSKDVRVRLTPEYYYEDGTKVDFSKAPALVTTGSTSYDYYAGHVESVQNLKDMKFIPITGSSIVETNGVYAATSNNSHAEGVDMNGHQTNGRSKYDASEWDVQGASRQWFGMGAFQITGQNPSFEFVSHSYNLANDLNEHKGYWQQLTTQLVVPTALKPTEPIKPTPPGLPNNTVAPKDPVKLTDAVVVNTTHVEVGTGKELAPQEEGTKPKKDIPGYEYVETKDDNGNTIHYYKPVDKTPIKPNEDKKVYTRHYDITTGKELTKQEDGTQPKRTFDGYEFVETKTKDGDTEHYYKPVAKPITRHIDKETGKELTPPEEGNKPKKDIPGYRFVETKDKDGNTEHYYQKVRTRHYDVTTGKELVPQEDGTQPKKDIPGYEFVETKDKDGDTEHFYKPVKKVVTKHIDKKTGKELVPQEDGTQPKKDIPGYRFVETKDEDGNTIHYYEQVITKHINIETGEEIAPQEDGSQPKKDIEGFEFVETKDENGDTHHFYRPIKKVYTKHIDKETGKELAPQEDGKQPKRTFDGYEFVETKDEDGNTIHYYQKVKPVAQIKGKTPAKYAETNESSGMLATLAGLLLASVLAFFVKKRKSN